MSSHYLSSHYGGSHYLSSHYGRVGITPPFTPDDVPHPPGTDEITADRRRKIMEEEELLMLVIQAFLHMRNRR